MDSSTSEAACEDEYASNQTSYQINNPGSNNIRNRSSEQKTGAASETVILISVVSDGMGIEELASMPRMAIVLNCRKVRAQKRYAEDQLSEIHYSSCSKKRSP